MHRGSRKKNTRWLLKNNCIFGASRAGCSPQKARAKRDKMLITCVRSRLLTAPLLSLAHHFAAHEKCRVYRVGQVPLHKGERKNVDALVDLQNMPRF
jgi:hypothetical protein